MGLLTILSIPRNHKGASGAIKVTIPFVCSRGPCLFQQNLLRAEGKSTQNQILSGVFDCNQNSDRRLLHRGAGPPEVGSTRSGLGHRYDSA